MTRSSYVINNQYIYSWLESILIFLFSSMYLLFFLFFRLLLFFFSSFILLHFYICSPFVSSTILLHFYFFSLAKKPINRTYCFDWFAPKSSSEIRRCHMKFMWNKEARQAWENLNEFYIVCQSQSHIVIATTMLSLLRDT